MNRGCARVGLAQGSPWSAFPSGPHLGFVRGRDATRAKTALAALFSYAHEDAATEGFNVMHTDLNAYSSPRLSRRA